MPLTICNQVSKDILVISLNNPKRLNALGPAMLEELVTNLEQAEQRKVKVVILTGNDKSFCSGFDLQTNLINDSDFEEFKSRMRNNIATSSFATKFNFILIAAISGYTMGGGLELAMACDLVYSVKSTVLAMPEVKIGLLAGAGGTQYLSHYMGNKKALEYLITGDRFTAQQAEEWGIVNGVLDSYDDMMTKCMRVAELITERYDGAIRTKQLVYKAGDENFRAQEVEAFLDLLSLQRGKLLHKL